MLRISPASSNALEDAAWPGFIERLREAYEAEYPHVLPCFPPDLQFRIVENMVGRAERWGIWRQDAFAIFTELMMAIAPNFDEHPDISAVLSDDDEDINEIVATLDERIEDSVWEEVEANAADLPLFVPAALIDAPLEVKVAAAIDIALAGVPLPAPAAEIARRAMAEAYRLGLADETDAPLAVAAWRIFYGDSATDVRRHEWLADLFNQALPARTRVAQLKFQIALDFNRFV